MVSLGSGLGLSRQTKKKKTVPLQIIGTNGQILGQSSTGLTNGADTLDDCRWLAKVPHAVKDISLLYGNFYFFTGTSTNEINGPSTITVDAAIEYSSAYYPQLFNGASTKAIASSDGVLLGDAISGLSIPAGTSVYIRNSARVSAGQQIPIGRQRNTPTGEDSRLSSNASSQTYGTGALSAGVSAAYGYAPLALIGRPTTPKVSIVLFGDSIADATAYDAVDANGNRGSFAKAFYAADIPFVKATRGSMRIYGFHPARSPKLWTVVPYCSHVVIQPGTNDLAQAASGDYTLAAIQANYQAMWAQARVLGKKVIQCTILPRTTSTDSFATPANQTTVSRFGVGQDRDTLNAWFNAQLAAGNIDAVWDLNSVYEDPANLGKWKTNGTAFYATSDGTHPSTNAGGFNASVSTLQSLASALSVSDPTPITYEPEAIALFARMSVQPGTARKNLISSRITAGKAYSFWNKLDALWIHAAHDAQAARLNWLGNVYNCSTVNNPVFTTDRGYLGDGSTSYLDTGFNPTTASSPKFTQNSGTLGIRCNTNNAASGSLAGFYDGTKGTTINPYDGSTFSARLNQASATYSAAGAVTTSVGMTVVSRTGASSLALYRDGVLKASDSMASSALANGNLRLGSISASSFRACELSMSFVASGLTAQEVQDIYNWFDVYRAAVGVV